MKRILFLCLLFLTTGAAAALAQERANGISISIGGPIGGARYESLGYDYGYYGSDLYGLYHDFESYSATPSLIVGYTHRISGSVRIGGDFSVGSYTLSVTPGAASRDREIRTYDAAVFTLMPIAEWSYYSDEASDFYMRAGLGAEFSTGGRDGNRLRPCWQITPLGLHVGSKTYFLGELGFGTEYIIRLGIGFSF